MSVKRKVIAVPLRPAGQRDMIRARRILMSVRTKQWTREEYDRLVAAGAFHPEDRVQLIRGEIVEMIPQSAAHATSLRRLQKALDAIFREGYDVRAQLPLALGEHSEPEPDIAVVPGSLDVYRDHHPTTAALLVEVADSSLAFDRTQKLAMYAAAQIPEYWVVNLVDRVLEVYRDPQGAAYRTALRLGPDQAVTPLAAPAARLRVGDLFL
jgi:Uma2 family endonuclease